MVSIYDRFIYYLSEKDKRGLTAVAIVSRRVGTGIERPVGSTAVGKKSAKRNELGNPNDTLETLSCLIKSKERPQVVTNDYRMLLCKVTVKLGHSFHLSFLYKSRCSSIVEHQSHYSLHLAIAVACYIKHI